MAYLYRLIAYAFLGIAATWCLLLPLKAHAAFPASSGYYHSVRGGSPADLHPSAAAACADVVARYNAQVPSGGAFVQSVSGLTCNWAVLYEGVTYQESPATIFVASNALCPANSTLAGGQCSCSSGYDQSGSTCVNPTEALCGALSGTETYASAPGQIAPGASSCNPTGCGIIYSGTVIRVKNAQGVYVTEGAATFTGATCTYSSETGSTPDTCPGGSLGTINGVSTCVPYDPALNTIESVKGSTNELSDGTNETTTGKTTTTVCSAVGSCTTTTVTQTSVNGGAPTTTTETTEENRDDFCTKNPKDPQCSNSAFAGSCSGGFTCSGDAIQCAVAKQTHELNCTLNKDSPQKTLFEQERSSTPGLADIDGRTETISSASFASNNSLGASACIPNLAVTVMGQSIALPFSDICDELAYLRLVLLACSWFIAYRTVAGSVREG